MTLERTLATPGRETRAARMRRRTNHLQGTNQDQSHPRRRLQNHPSPSQAPVHPPHRQSMSQRVTNQVPPAPPPPSPQALLPRQPPPPPSPRSRPARGRAQTQQRSPSRPLQLQRRKAGSHRCHLRQGVGFPRCERRKAVLRMRLVLLKIEGRNRQEVGRGQVGARVVVEEVFLTRSPGLRASLSSKLSFCSTCTWPLTLFN